MIRTRRSALLRFAAAGLLAASLSGCISLLPKSKPAELYRFGAGDAAGAARPASLAAARVGVAQAFGEFQREAAGDRILTVTGGRAAYIAQARWVAPAQVLFDQAVQAAFEQTGPVRLVARGEPARSAYSLRLDVRNFETRYDAGPGAAPTVLVRVHAVLSRDADRSVTGEQVFEARVPAAENRVTAIVEAYDQALGQVLEKIRGFVDAAATPVAA